MMLKLIAGFSVAAALAAATPFLYGDAARGAAIFQSKNCVTCHSVNGQGGKIAPDLGKRGGAGFTPVSLAAMLWNHAPQMWGELKKSTVKIQLTPQDSADLFAYFYAARYMDPAGDAGRGNNGHSLSGESPVGAKPVLKWESLADPIELARAMWNHSAAMHAAMEKQGKKAPALTAPEMNDMLVYLRSLPQARDSKPQFQPASAETGETLFDVKGCNSCHKGQHSLVKRIAFRSVSDFAASMWNHTVPMKQQPELRPEEMKRLVGYIWSLQFAADTGDAAKGAKVFAAKGCNGCHDGGTAPVIAGKIGDAYTLIASLTEHGPTMMQKFESNKQGWPQMKDTEMEDLLQYLKSGK